jgi:hypothetical protein
MQAAVEPHSFRYIEVISIALGTAAAFVIPVLLYNWKTRREDKKEREKQHGENQHLLQCLVTERTVAGGVHYHKNDADGVVEVESVQGNRVRVLTASGLVKIPLLNGKPRSDS